MLLVSKREKQNKQKTVVIPTRVDLLLQHCNDLIVNMMKQNRRAKMYSNKEVYRVNTIAIITLVTSCSIVYWPEIAIM